LHNLNLQPLSSWECAAGDPAAGDPAAGDLAIRCADSPASAAMADIPVEMFN
jgi:hypothetical protein